MTIRTISITVEIDVNVFEDKSGLSEEEFVRAVWMPSRRSATSLRRGPRSRRSTCSTASRR